MTEADLATIQESCSRDHRSRVVVVGGGASGVLLACHLLRNPTSGQSVTLIEKSAELGRGLAYLTTNPEHLLNVRAANMSAFPDQPDHFWRWLRERRSQEPITWRGCGDPYCFVPRKVYGDYIASLIAPYQSDGRLHIIRGECISISELQSGVALTLVDGSRIRGDFAVLATGHEAAPPYGGCYVDPWTPPADAGVAPDSRILIVGTGLTMVDYVLSLTLSGHTGPIFAISRRGLLSRAHRPVQPLRIDKAAVPFGAGMSKLLRWLRNLIEREAARGGDWRGVVDGIRPFTQEIWQRLSIPARRSFLEHGRAWWEVHRHRMAPEIEERINAAVTSGRLTLIAAKLCGIEPGPAAAVVRYRRRGATTVETMHVDKIVECRQIGATPLQSVNPALRSLLERGFARFDPLNIGIDVTTDSAIISRSGVPSMRLFAIGPLTRAAFWEIIAIPDIRNQCMALANHLSHARPTPPSRSSALPAEESQPV